MKRLLITIVLMLLFLGAKAQTDTEFWFALPVMSYDTENTISQNIHCTTSDSSANITVEFLYDDTTYTFNLTLNTLDQQGIPIPAMNGYQVMTPQRRSVHVTSDVPIDCYYDKRSPTGERYTLKGHSALGTDFLVPGQNYYPLVSGKHPSAEIVATEDSTDIQIYAYVSLYGGIPAFTPVNVTLQQGECYAVMPDGNGDITGTRIHSSHPVAVNVSYPSVFPILSDSLSIDDVGDQIVPTALLGSRYAAISKRSYESRVFIFPTESNTSVTINGTDIGQTLSPGGFCNHLLDTSIEIHYITADKPIAVFQTRMDSTIFRRYLQPAGILLPHLDCTGSRQASALTYQHDPARWSIQSGCHIICKTADTASFSATYATGGILDPHWLAHRQFFRPIPGDSTLSWTVNLLSWSDVLIIKNSTGNFLLFSNELGHEISTFTCHTSYDSASSSFLFFDTSRHIFCTGDSIRLPLHRYGTDDIVIDGPNGLHLTVATDTVVLPADTAASGIYHISALDIMGCHSNIFTDSITISVIESYNDTIFDTIVQNQLPWQRFGITFSDDADTLIFRPGTDNACDSVINYHLKVYFNHYDTVFYYACPDQLPLAYDTLTFDHEGDYSFAQAGSHGEDSILTFSLHIVPSTDTTIYDSILEAQLPWFAFDTIFNDTIADFIYHTYNEAGCDSIIHYNLHIYWEGDHCDTSLTFTNVVTPNGDGANDRFVIGGLIENNCFKYNELTILNRWGTPVYHKINIATDEDWWDPAAQRAPTGTYFFLFKAHGVNIYTQHAGVIEVLHDK
ncbi:MAG: gliding motility-associated C-terminal domain-containing protein [Bacteroidales bacterium]|nr:gliding motility-associated C-terminal domain-containing protein [Bacteroidales bacterium]